MINLNGNTIINPGLQLGPNKRVQSGSMLFSGLDFPVSLLTVPNDIDFRFGTGDFTIEWFQFQTDNMPFTRPWSQGDWPGATIGVSLESGDFLYWQGGQYIIVGTLNTYKNVWVHFAISRSGTIIKIFQNGIQFGSDINSSYDYNDTYSMLGIGNEPTYPYPGLTSFGGNITNFRWIKGDAVYTSNFIVPTQPLTSTPNTKLLLLSKNEQDSFIDSSGLDKIIHVNNVTWSSNNPF